MGECIYCFTADLPLCKEHIVPYGLHGEWLLLNASCDRCGGITSAFEGKVLRGLWGAPRAGLPLPSRRGHRDAEFEFIAVVADGTSIPVRLPPGPVGRIVMFPVLPEAGVLVDDQNESDLQLLDYVIAISPDVKPALAAALEKQGVPEENVSFTTTVTPQEFARFLAKVAYGFGVAQFGLDVVKSSALREIVNGNTATASRWLGCNPASAPPEEGDISVRLQEIDDDLVLAEMRFFGNLPNTPTYHACITVDR